MAAIETTDEALASLPRVTVGLLRELAGIHGLTLATGEIERRVSHYPLAEASIEQAFEQVKRCAPDLGLRPSTAQGTVAEIAADLDRGRPAALGRVGPDGEIQWLVIRAARRGRVDRAWITTDGSVPQYAWTSVRDLLRELGASSGSESLTWMLIDPISPAAGAAGAAAPLHPLWRLLRFVRPDRADLWAVLVFSVASGVLLLATPIAVQALVGFVALGGTPPQVIAVALMLLVGLGLAGVLTGVQTWIVEILQRRVFVRSVAELSARLPQVRFDVYQAEYGPELVNRFFDVITIQKTSANLLLGGLGIVLNMLVGLAVLAFYHPLLLAFDILLVLAILVIVLGPVRAGIRTAKKESSAKYEMAAWLEALASNPLLFKAGGSGRWAYEQSDALATKYVRARAAHFKILFGQIVSAIALQVVASTALLGIGGLLVMQGSLTLGQLVAAELIVTVVVTSVAKMGKHVESFYDLMAAVDKLGVLLDLPTERQGEQRFVPTPQARGAGLRLDDVACTRPNGEPLFDTVSVDVAPGGTLGVTGPSGSGKSALTQLLWRLREPSRGAIHLDGFDVRTLSLDSLRRTVAVAPASHMVEATIEENVRAHRSFVTDEDLRSALADVGLADVISRLPEEMRTQLGHDGHPLSYGETVQLLIARAIAGRPLVLVIDGILDGLSEQTRKRLCDVLFAEDAPWTLVVSSNMPDVLSRCGEVLELGEEDTREVA